MAKNINDSYTYDGLKYNLDNRDIVAASAGTQAVKTGTVTQASNHGTAVTLNACAGVITLAGVALNAGAEADFAFTNSCIQADSVVLLTVQSPAATDATDNATIVADLDEISAGACNIRLTNPGAGNSASDANKIHFLVINNDT